MQRKNPKLLSITRYAKLRGLNPSTIARQVQRGQIALVDGLIDPERADRDRARNLNPAKTAEAARRKAEPKVTAKPTRSLPLSGTLVGDAIYAERLRVLQQISSVAEQLEFARVALRMGCTAVQAHALASQFICQPVCALDVDSDDLTCERFPEPTAEQWRAVLGDFDVYAAEVLFGCATSEEDGQGDAPPTS